MVKKLLRKYSQTKTLRDLAVRSSTNESRITEMRNQLVKAFEEENLTRFSFIKDQHGMFSYSGLGIKHAAQLREKFGVYILDSGRICIAALNKNNLKYVANAISTVVHKKTIQAKSFK